jgi:hypothetical protein
MNGNTTKMLFVLCGIAWVVLVGRAWMNAKNPEDFVFKVPHEQVDAYAREALNELQTQSFARDQEFCAIIFENSDGTLGNNKVRDGSKASCNIAYFDGPGMAPRASMHTHGGHDRDYDSEVPSLIDLESDMDSGTVGYVSTPGGRLWKVEPERERVVQLCGEGCLKQDPDYAPCPADDLKEEYSLAELRERSRAPFTAC